MNFKTAYTFDDVVLIPNKSNVSLSEVDISSYLTNSIKLKVPILSSPMDTVTEHNMAIAMAQIGGIGFIHRNMDIETQVGMVRKVKKHEGWIIYNPMTSSPNTIVAEICEIMEHYQYSAIPIIDPDNNKLLGIVTNRYIRFTSNKNIPIKDIMTKENLITVKEGIEPSEALKLLNQYKIEKLIVVDDNYACIGLITVKDIENFKRFPNASKDRMARLLVGSAIGVGKEAIERAEALINVNVDVLTIDTAHGHSDNVINTLKTLKEHYKDFPIIAGNVVTENGALELINAGADAIKVGIGPGSICTTRIVTGAGMPQLSAIQNVKEACIKKGARLIADGGIRYSGDIAKAIAAGADTVMLGFLLAGSEEGPGETVVYKGRTYKRYRGMGSNAAMQGNAKDRYGINKNTKKSVPEGVEGRVPLKGSVKNIVEILTGGLTSAMGYTGNTNIEEMKNNCSFIAVTAAGYKESHAHDIHITDESLNYKPFASNN